ncbi:MAG TPA: CaiB/BaiF CoA-transferase family protein, partial [Actinomycetota bacterium]|nr:CaiB/BaiF CoA-transferase family protein [Actinomycetota bacterium]
MSALPLEGVRVLDLTRLLPGGYATLMLADLGADVVKVEEPGRADYTRWLPPQVGDSSAAHIALNRNKRSITLNLKTARGKDIFRKLVPRFDVLVESFRPGKMAALELGWESLQDLHPQLIYCAITGYGQDGPRAQEVGHDINYMGYAGALGITGEEGRAPVIPGVQVADLGGGGMAAVISILLALRKRDAEGVGSFCDVSMMDGVVSWLGIHAAAYRATGDIPQPELMPLNGGYPCYRVYPAADGWLTVGALEPQFWSALCSAIGRDDLVGDAFASGRRRAQVIGELEELFETKTRAEWMRKLAGLDVCVAPVNDFSEAFADEQASHRQMVVEEDLPEVGSWSHIGNPVRVGERAERLLRIPPPSLGGG